MPVSQLASAVVALCLLGCGSASDAVSSASCTADTHCGGDVTGNWSIDSECLTFDSPFQNPECQSAIKNVSVAIQGTVSYSPSRDETIAGTENVTARYQFSATEQYTSRCLKSLGFEGATPDACHGLELLWAGAIAVDCRSVSDACECQFADSQASSESESFMVVDNQILLSSSGVVGFCQEGDRLVEEATTPTSRSVVTLHRVTQ